MMRHALLFAMCLWGCSSNAPLAVSTVTDAGAEAEAGPPKYPPGPYGLKEGDVFGDASMHGYLADPTHTDVTTLPIVDTSLGELRDAHPECQCMLIAVAGRWCTPSIKDQTDVLPTLLTKPSRCIVSIVAEAAMVTVPANEDDLTVVGKTTKPHFPLVLAPTLSPAIMMASASLPANFVVRTDTMKIVTEGSETTPKTIFDVCESTN